jgi:pyridoxal phosphate enzyme (YggS family)
VEAAWAAGLTQVGENRVQEAIVKMDAVVSPVEWHLIGHLQRNKVKHLDRFVLFHALDSERLAAAVDAHGLGRGAPVPVLVQVNVLGEGSKGGFAPAELAAAAEQLRRAGGLMVRGAMTMAPLGADEVTLRRTFGGCREALGVLREAGHQASELSMGMSNDYEVAVEEGATMVRLGTILFGERVP